MDDIRIAAKKGMVLRNERFTAEIERLTGRRMTAKKWAVSRVGRFFCPPFLSANGGLLVGKR
ncbi:hypothetical protein AU255_12670 [Methyloprofundus sedimenti]|uniref:Uncharacterized protein n=1 Tax=Methyloprofundus sedimenti TaxID=1420851 RepID=A0A1V8MBB6_9GAMM|nr:hypothetical protein [Methyloprofundus sedimenti]OQK18623.1 hypothetical protein AU255_12670 [Methyloprofundus sedimenti]